MRASSLRGDLALLRSGLSLGWSFGLEPLEELARTALELENGIYRTGALERVGPRVEFRLHNPPLRIGAFRGVAVRWDGADLPADRVWVATDRRPELRRAAGISEADPLELETGEGSRFALEVADGATGGSHRVRIAWQSRAIPPTVWLEFVDTVRPGPGP